MTLASSLAFHLHTPVCTAPSLPSKVPERRPGVEAGQDRACSPQALGSNALPSGFCFLICKREEPYIRQQGAPIQQIFTEFLVRGRCGLMPSGSSVRGRELTRFGETQ